MIHTSKKNRPARVIPPLGAHAIRRMLPSAYWLLGKEFEHYDPLLSENMRYIARPEYEDAEITSSSDRAYSWPECKGRSIMLVGCDYFLIYDDVYNQNMGSRCVSALNKEHTSAPSVIYPMYFTSAKPHYPDGLKLEIMNNRIELSWGKVLGCKDYKLYKKTGNGPFRLIHSGNDNEYTDNRYSEGEYYEYTVSTRNGNGESELCQPVTTNPDSWLNFDPVKGEPFRRTVTLKSSIDNDGNRVPSYYPE